MPNPNAELQSFLVNAFADWELRALTQYSTALAPLSADINWNGAAAQVAFDFVGALQKHGVLDEAFFDILRSERPARVTEIDRIAGLFDGGGTPRESVPPPASALSRPKVYQTLVRLSPGDLNTLVTIFLDDAARAVVGQGQSAQATATALIGHYDTPHRGLDKLMALIRQVTEG